MSASGHPGSLPEDGAIPSKARRRRRERFSGTWARRSAVRRGPWKLAVQDESGPMLFNLDNDLGETKNLAGQETGMVRQMQEALVQWEKDVTPRIKKQ
jgi:hypothetical protein